MHIAYQTMVEMHYEKYIFEFLKILYYKNGSIGASKYI